MIARCLGMCYRAARLTVLVLEVLVLEVLVLEVLVLGLGLGLDSEDPMVESIWESSSTSALPLFRPPSLWMSFPVLRCLKRGVGIPD